MAITFIKSMGIFTKKEYADIRNQGIEWLNKQSEIIMASACEGMGMNAFIMSLHENYSDYNRFMLKLRLEMGDFIDESQSILVDLGATERLKPLHLKYLAEAKKTL